MLRWAQQGERPSFQLLVLHDDAEREVASDADTDAVLAIADRLGWHVASMATDWHRIFARPLERSDSETSPEPDAEPAMEPTEETGGASEAGEPAAADAPAAVSEPATVPDS